MDDLISRQAAIDALEKISEMFPYRIPGKAETYRQYNEAWCDAIDVASGELEKFPAVQPERKTGRWMFGFNNQYLEKYYYCSNCGCRKHTEDEPSDYFCSNCGADMRGGDSDE